MLINSRQLREALCLANDDIDGDMHPGFRDLASGAFESGLAKLDKDPAWYDDRTDLDGPFRLSFPGARGWGEDLLVASLLKRSAAISKARVKVFANWQACSILKHDPVYQAEMLRDDTEGSSPLAILRHALVGNLLEKPFIPLSTPEAPPSSPTDRRSRVGMVWASLSNNRAIDEKSVPLEQFLPLLASIDADFLSLQRQLAVADPNGLFRDHGGRHYQTWRSAWIECNRELSCPKNGCATPIIAR